MTKQIPLSRDKFVVVDDDVYEWASQYKWYAHRSGNTFYACRKGGVWPFRKAIYLHREIMQAPSNVMVDHTNNNGLDCRRANMRLCTQTENNRNASRRTDNTSGYRGVDLHRGKWRARIKFDGKQVSLGGYDTPEAAAVAYDAAAKRHYGEFAKTNF